MNHLWEFHHIYHFVAIGDKGELIRFWGQKVKGQGHSETTCGQISTLADIFLLVCGMYGCILMKLVTVTRYQVHVTWMTSSRSWVQRSRSRQHFPTKALLQRRHSSWWFKDDLVVECGPLQTVMMSVWWVRCSSWP